MPEMPRIVVRVPPEDLARWKELASQQGRDMSNLVRFAVNFFADRFLVKPGRKASKKG